MHASVMKLSVRIHIKALKASVGKKDYGTYLIFIIEHNKLPDRPAVCQK